MLVYAVPGGGAATTSCVHSRFCEHVSCSVYWGADKLNAEQFWSVLLRDKTRGVFGGLAYAAAMKISRADIAICVG